MISKEKSVFMIGEKSSKLKVVFFYQSQTTQIMTFCDSFFNVNVIIQIK